MLCFGTVQYGLVWYGKNGVGFNRFIVNGKTDLTLNLMLFWEEVNKPSDVIMDTVG
jgi:hypothetical protein